MRGDGARQGVVLVFEGISQLLTFQRVYRHGESICFEKDGFRNSTELYAEESSNLSGRLLEPGRRLSAWGPLP
jgi:hypothetical protein